MLTCHLHFKLCADFFLKQASTVLPAVSPHVENGCHDGLWREMILCRNVITYRPFCIIRVPPDDLKLSLNTNLWKKKSVKCFNNLDFHSVSFATLQKKQNKSSKSSASKSVWYCAGLSGGKKTRPVALDCAYHFLCETSCHSFQ